LEAISSSSPVHLAQPQQGRHPQGEVGIPKELNKNNATRKAAERKTKKRKRQKDSRQQATQAPTPALASRLAEVPFPSVSQLLQEEEEVYVSGLSIKASMMAGTAAVAEREAGTVALEPDFYANNGSSSTAAANDDDQHSLFTSAADFDVNYAAEAETETGKFNGLRLCGTAIAAAAEAAVVDASPSSLPATSLASDSAAYLPAQSMSLSSILWQ
jgi:hypothetical protein